MNIFLLDWNPQKAAQMHCDKHVIKMIIESAQMLYCAHWVIDSSKLLSNAYKKAHTNHPCSIWVRQSMQNYMWLCALGLHLCLEYKYRYGDHKTHKTEYHLEWLINNPPEIPDIGLTKPAQAMPEEYKNINPILAYQCFYVESKMKQRGIVKYTKRNPPEFLKCII
jgi:hypothetical protein